MPFKGEQAYMAPHAAGPDAAGWMSGKLREFFRKPGQRSRESHPLDYSLKSSLHGNQGKLRGFRGNAGIIFFMM